MAIMFLLLIVVLHYNYKYKDRCVYVLKFHKSRHRECRAKGELKCDVVLHRGMEIDTCDIFLEPIVWDDVYAVAGSDLW